MKHYIKDGKIIREIKEGGNITYEEITDEEFKRYQVGKSKNGFILLAVLFWLVIVFLYTVISKL